MVKQFQFEAARCLSDMLIWSQCLQLSSVLALHVIWKYLLVNTGLKLFHYS